MSMSDPLGDMLTRIRNGQRARQAVVAAPASGFRANVLEVLKREGYIRGYDEEAEVNGSATLRISIAILSFRAISCPRGWPGRPGRWGGGA